ncbi:MAG: hypothetical protein ACREEM_38015 [Blastocatellia bacterium]
MFDWSDYEKLARSLRNGDEAAKRSAISRLYYSIYHRALQKLEEVTDFAYSADKPAHQQVWDRYANEGRTLTAIGRKGKELRGYREKADYASAITSLDRLLNDSFDVAEAILHWLDKIQPPQ